METPTSEVYEMTDAQLVKMYVDIQTEIKQREAEASDIKVLLTEHLDKDTKVHEFDGVVAEWCQGRTVTKMDEKKVRMNLAFHNVDLKVIDECFTKGTTTTVGEPSLRISKVKK